MEAAEALIRDFLCEIGITARYSGFVPMVTAIRLVLSDSGYIGQATKKLYPDVAKICGDVPWTRIERNLRTIIDVFWKGSRRKEACKLLSIPGSEKPTAMRFIRAVCSKLKKNGVLQK